MFRTTQLAVLGSALIAGSPLLAGESTGPRISQPAYTYSCSPDDQISLETHASLHVHTVVQTCRVSQGIAPLHHNSSLRTYSKYTFKFANQTIYAKADASSGNRLDILSMFDGKKARALESDDLTPAQQRHIRDNIWRDGLINVYYELSDGNFAPLVHPEKATISPTSLPDAFQDLSNIETRGS